MNDLITTIDDTKQMLHAYNNILKRVHDIYETNTVMTFDEWCEIFGKFESEIIWIKP